MLGLGLRLLKDPLKHQDSAAIATSVQPSPRLLDTHAIATRSAERSLHCIGACEPTIRQIAQTGLLQLDQPQGRMLLQGVIACGPTIGEAQHTPR